MIYVKSKVIIGILSLSGYTILYLRYNTSIVTVPDADDELDTWAMRLREKRPPTHRNT